MNYKINSGIALYGEIGNPESFDITLSKVAFNIKNL